jgi:hypothetical protein
MLESLTGFLEAEPQREQSRREGKGNDWRCVDDQIVRRVL